MIFDIHIPKMPLGRHVDKFLYFEQADTPYLIERFLPDGNVELVFTLKDEPQFVYDNDTLEKMQKCEGGWASGVRTKPISIPSGQDSKMFVVIFRKGMAYPFFPLPMDELRDSVVEADLIWGNTAGTFREKLMAAPDSESRFEVAEQFLLSLLHKSHVDTGFVEYGVSKIIADPSGLSLDTLSNEIGYSRRHFIKKFKAGVGLSPKPYMRVLRFQKAIEEIETGEIDWAGIALDCGYYDQSHFINDFRTFSGFTPSDYLARKNGNINYVPVA